MSKKKDEFYFVFSRDSSLEDDHWYFVDSCNSKEEAEKTMEEAELDTEIEHKVIKGYSLLVEQRLTVTKFEIMEK